MDVAVRYDYCSVPAGLHLAVMIDDDVLAVFSRYIIFVSGQQGNIPRLRGGLAVNFNFALFGGQVHILVGCYRLHIPAVVTDMDVPFFRLNTYAALQRFDLMRNGNVAFARLCGHVAYHIDIPVKGNVPKIVYDYLNGAFGQGVVRYLDCAVIGMQRQVSGSLGIRRLAGRIQNTVLQDHDIVACGLVFVVRMYADIAVSGLGLAVHGNRTVLGGQHDILLCHQSRVVGCVMSDGDVALSGFNIDAAAKGNNRMVFRGSIIGSLSHGYIAVVGHDINIPANNDISPKLYVAYIIHNHIKISLCQGIIGYFNTAVIGMQCQVAA